MRIFLTTVSIGLSAVLASAAYADKPAEPKTAVTKTAAKTAAPKGPSAREIAAAQRVAEQQAAMKALKLVDGDWRGPSKKLTKGDWVAMTQTEKVDTLMGGTMRTISSLGYDKDGSLSFESFSVISYDPNDKAYSIRTYSGGRPHDYPLEVTADGFKWEAAAGRKMTIRYQAMLKDGAWTQSATRVPASGAPEKYVEFTVKRGAAVALPAAKKIAAN
ncbi:MAG TPA: hypothetical protein VG942_07470 [Hyphomonadaceae bacterium]|nr:hypothetical protein [Hyphomonadaceae bacterium]